MTWVTAYKHVAGKGFVVRVAGLAEVILQMLFPCVLLAGSLDGVHRVGVRDHVSVRPTLGGLVLIVAAGSAKYATPKPFGELYASQSSASFCSVTACIWRKRSRMRPSIGELIDLVAAWAAAPHGWLVEAPKDLERGSSPRCYDGPVSTARAGSSNT